jgi:hypothetical protein
MRLIPILIAAIPLFAPSLASAVACRDLPASQALPVRTALVAPLAPGMIGRPGVVASPHALLAPSRDESLALDLVLLRLQLESCVKDDYASYKPKTQFDNTPWRFNMEKGKKFDAAQFDAWMKSRGVRVAKGNPAAAATQTAAPVTTPTAAPAAVKD